MRFKGAYEKYYFYLHHKHIILIIKHEVFVHIVLHDHITATTLLLIKRPFKGSKHIYNIPQVMKNSHIEHLGIIYKTHTFHYRGQEHIQY